MSPSSTKISVALTAFLAGVLAISLLAAGIDYPPAQYTGTGIITVDQSNLTISATMPTDFSGTNCTSCTMTGPTTLISSTTLDGSPVATSDTVSAAIAAIAFPVTSVNGSGGAVTGLETTTHAAATYSTPASVAAALGPYLTSATAASTYSTPASVATILTAYPTTVAMNAAIAAAQPQKAHLTTATDGTLTWTYPTACGAGVVPYVQALARGVSGSTDVLNAQLDGVQTNTQAKFRVTRTAVTAVSLIGLSILSVPSSPGAVPLDLQVSCT